MSRHISSPRGGAYYREYQVPPRQRRQNSAGASRYSEQIPRVPLSRRSHSAAGAPSGPAYDAPGSFQHQQHGGGQYSPRDQGASSGSGAGGGAGAAAAAAAYGLPKRGGLPTRSGSWSAPSSSSSFGGILAAARNSATPSPSLSFGRMSPRPEQSPLQQQQQSRLRIDLTGSPGLAGTFRHSSQSPKATQLKQFDIPSLGGGPQVQNFSFVSEEPSAASLPRPVPVRIGGGAIMQPQQQQPQQQQPQQQQPQQQQYQQEHQQEPEVLFTADHATAGYGYDDGSHGDYEQMHEPDPYNGYNGYNDDDDDDDDNNDSDDSDLRHDYEDAPPPEANPPGSGLRFVSRHVRQHSSGGRAYHAIQLAIPGVGRSLYNESMTRATGQQQAQAQAQQQQQQQQRSSLSRNSSRGSNVGGASPRSSSPAAAPAAGGGRRKLSSHRRSASELDLLQAQLDDAAAMLARYEMASTPTFGSRSRSFGGTATARGVSAGGGSGGGVGGGSALHRFPSASSAGDARDAAATKTTVTRLDVTADYRRQQQQQQSNQRVRQLQQPAFSRTHSAPQIIIGQGGTGSGGAGTKAGGGRTRKAAASRRSSSSSSSRSPSSSSSSSSSSATSPRPFIQYHLVPTVFDLHVGGRFNEARILALDAPNRVVVTARFDRPAGRVMVMQSSDASRYARGQAYRKKAKGINGMIVAIDLTQNLIVVDNDLTPH